MFGCGGVGSSVIMGAKLAHAGKIIGVDIAENKLAWARQFGATDVVDGSKVDPVAAIKELTGGNGVDYAFEAAPRRLYYRPCGPATWRVPVPSSASRTQP